MVVSAANAAGGELLQGCLLDHPEIEATREDAVAAFVQTGTSLARHRRFEADARQLRRDWLSAVESPLMAGRRLTDQQFEALPRPQFAEVALGRVAGVVAAIIPMLLVFAGLALALARAAFRRFMAGSASA